MKKVYKIVRIPLVILLSLFMIFSPMFLIFIKFYFLLLLYFLFSLVIILLLVFDFKKIDRYKIDNLKKKNIIKIITASLFVFIYVILFSNTFSNGVIGFAGDILYGLDAVVNTWLFFLFPFNIISIGIIINSLTKLIYIKNYIK